MLLTTDVGWLCLDDLDPDSAGIQVWLALPDPCPLHDDPAVPCHNVTVRDLDAAGTLTRYRHCHPDGPTRSPTPATSQQCASCGPTARPRSSGRPTPPYFHRVVARHRPGP